MVWRLRMHRVRRLAQKAFRFARTGGMAGAVLLVLYGTAHDHIEHGHSGVHAWTMAAMGLCILLAGIGYALHGEAPSVREYAEGDTEEMPGISKLISGLAASAGGIALMAVGVVNMMA